MKTFKVYGISTMDPSVNCTVLDLRAESVEEAMTISNERFGMIATHAEEVNVSGEEK